MTVIDIVVLAIIGISVVYGVFRGLVREVLALLAWVAAFLLANLLAPDAAKLLPQGMGSEEVRLLVSYVIVFIIVLVAFSVLAVLASKLVKVVGLGASASVWLGVESKMMDHRHGDVSPYPYGC